MANSTLWWLIAGAAVALELVSGTIYLLLLGTGFAAAAVAAHLGAELATQIIVAAVVGVGAVAAWYLVRRGRAAEAPSRSNRNVNLDIGERIHVDAWQPDGTATVRYRGAQWTVLPREGLDMAPGEHRVVEMVGSRLVVDRL
ncbi:NfeD family protein [Variovorax ginsengisoli]|uniref:Membrane protein implicated in regulation of membrane protease activity n=1 Tax=Variovorax ginsengisoli TaxID=363844 RepID=A0ABT9SDA0_9BURK|nr:NfeD family protein [Variovorax ginsengisoli]MDP9901803.1 membrane protein implicated in regulation of membrane protease activity [Variovorax ginsengisoli]